MNDIRTGTKVKCECCSDIATKALFSPRTDLWRHLCPSHATEVVKNLKADGWNVEAENLD